MDARRAVTVLVVGLVALALALPAAAGPRITGGLVPDGLEPQLPSGGADTREAGDAEATPATTGDEQTSTGPGQGSGPPDHAPAPGWRDRQPPEDPAPEVADFTVGAAATSADPEPPFEGICLGGYGSWCGMPMEDILHPLFARGLAITGEQGDGETLVVVTVTAVGLFADYKPEWGDVGTQAIRERISERTGVPVSNILLQSDHSHASPDTIGIWGGVTVEYMEQLRDAAVDAGVRAVEAREPADLSVATVEGPPLRTLYDEPPTDRADTDFRVLFADAPDGERVATFVNYSPHATVLGNTGGRASGDWPAIAAEIVEDLGWGRGVATIGAIGATDWEERDTGVKNEEEARERLHRLLAEADATRQPVDGDDVAVTSTLISEPLAQPILLANLLPGVPGELAGQEGSLSMERAVTPPWLTGPVLTTVTSTAKVGDVLLWSNPGEAFPQLQFRIAEGVDATAHFPLGATNDFLGYMADDLDTYRQAFEAGTAFYLAGCPERDLRGAVGLDDGCNDHWTLMVSPTIGSHVVCTAQDAAEALGFEVDGDSRDPLCPALTATDREQG